MNETFREASASASFCLRRAALQEQRPPRRAGLYVRVAAQDELRLSARQEQTLAMAMRAGFSADELVVLAECGSGHDREREKFQQMLNLVGQNTISHVVTPTLFCLSRSHEQLSKTLKEFAHKGVVLITEDERFSPADLKSWSAFFDFQSHLQAKGGRLHG